MIALLLLDVFTVLQTFLVGWALSRTGSDGLQKLVGKPKDHWPYNIERGAILLIVPAVFYFVESTAEVAVIMASWLMQFMFLQQLFHNGTLKKFCVDNYGNNINESPLTTAVIKPLPWIKITLFVFGVLLAAAYYIHDRLR